MKIYDVPSFPNPLRVRIVIAEKKLASQIEFVEVDLPSAEHKQGAHLARNPLGTVPVLELDDGTFLSECTAITEYLDNLDGKPLFTGVTPREKATIHMMQRRAESELIDAIGLYFHHATPGLGPLLEVYKSPGWSGRAEWGFRQRDRAVQGMRYFDELLKTRPFVAGDTFSMADCTILGGLLFAGYAKIAVPEDCTTLVAWKARMHERPSVRNPA